MTRTPSLWLALALLAASAMPGHGQEGGLPLPERNPARLERSTIGPATPPAEQKPNLPGDQPTVQWEDPKVAAAIAVCAKLLDGVTLDYEQLPPIKRGSCGAPAPILVKSIGKDPAVAIEPPATITCPLAAALDAWFKERVQPAAAAFGSAVVKIRNASSYKCRNRYGGANTRISEHALANALDISEFVLASGQRVTVLQSWPRFVSTAALSAIPAPPLPNPHRVADRVAVEAAMAPIETTGAIIPVSSTRSSGSSASGAPTTATTNPFVGASPPPAARSPLPRTLTMTAADRLGAIYRAKVRANPFVTPLPAARNAPAPEPAQEKDGETEAKLSAPQPARKLDPVEEAAFVRAIHADACKEFETVLGPAANEAHRDHFHFDMKKRRYVKICE